MRRSSAVCKSNLQSRANHYVSTALLGALLALGMGLPCIAAEGTDAPARYSSLPSREQRLNASAPLVPSHDEMPVAFGNTSNRVCLVWRENFTLQSRVSTDGGVTYAAPVTIAGGAGQRAVAGFVARSTSNGRVYVAAKVVDAAAGLGLDFLRSDDLCGTWTAPLPIVSSGDEAYMLEALDIGVNTNGRVAIAYPAAQTGRPTVIASSNHGATWGTPVAIDTVANIFLRDIAVEIDNSDRIHAAWCQYATGHVFRSLSTNGGVSFSTPADFDTGIQSAYSIELAITSDNRVLAASWGNRSSATVVVVWRSSADGTSYTKQVEQPLQRGDYGDFALRLATAREVSSSSVVLLCNSSGGLGNLTALPSNNNGVTFGSPFVIASDVGYEYSLDRTSSGTWVAAWSNRWKKEVRVSNSFNGGWGWSTPLRIDSGSGGSASVVGQIAPYSSDMIIVPFAADRVSSQVSSDILAARSSAGTFAFTPEERVDGGDSVPVPSGTDALLYRHNASAASDGIDRVYMAFTWRATGPGGDVFVAASDSGGYSFGPAAQVSTTPAGTRELDRPAIAATPGGRIYVAWEAFTTDRAGIEIRFNRSLDRGATWLSSDQVLAYVPISAGYVVCDSWPLVRVAASGENFVFLVWSTYDSVKFQRSVNAGATFETAVNLNPSGSSFTEHDLCATGSAVFVSFAGNDTIEGPHSPDSGATWLAATVSASHQFFPDLACGPNGDALIASWGYVASDDGVYRNRFDGTSWGSPLKVIDGAQQFPEIEYTGATDVVVATYSANDYNQILAAHSQNSGVSFGSPFRVDDGAPHPDAVSWYPNVTSDRAGHVWISFLDLSVGQSQLVSRHSADRGATWDALLRHAGPQQQGAYEDRQNYWAQFAALPGTFFPVWWATRADAPLPQVLVNAHQPSDIDRDRSPNGSDCDNTSPDVYPGAPQYCDGRNNNCSDPAYPAVPLNEIDHDSDGYVECSPWIGPTSGAVHGGGDCNDTNSSIYPGAPEACNGANESCLAGYPTPSANETDDDGDGYVECSPWTGGGTLLGGDCDDAHGTVYPGAPSICDGRNNDCADPAWPASPYEETDHDGDGTAFCNGDCNDADPAIRAGATEVCNGADDDCDGPVDEVCDARCDFPAKVSLETDLSPDASSATVPKLTWTGSVYGVVWADSKDSTTEIYFSRYTATLSRIGDLVRVTNAPGISQQPVLVWNGSEFGIAWNDARDGNDEVYFTRLDALGNKLGGDVRVTNAAGVSRFPRINWSGVDYGLSWNDQRSGTFEGYFARVSAAGIVVPGSERRITAETIPASDSLSPRAVWNGSVYGVIYYDQRDGNQEIYFQTLDREGIQVVPETRLTNAAGNSRTPSIAWDAKSGQFGIIWTDARNGADELFFMRVASNGVKLTGDQRLVSINAPAGNNSSIVHSGAEFALTWQDAPSGNPEVYFARLANDAFNGAQVRVTNDPAISTGPLIEWTGSEYAVSFLDNRSGTNRAYVARIGCCGASTIGDRVWLDGDRDGIQDPLESGIGGALVSVYDETGTPLAVKFSGSDGSYQFSGLFCGDSYQLRVVPPIGYVLSPRDQGADDMLDSDPDSTTGATGLFVVTPGSDATRWDAGVAPCWAPDEPIYIERMTLTGELHPVLHFMDPNQPRQVTGYNVRRSSQAAPPPETWPLVATDVVDMDEGTPNKQWIDESGDISPTGIWYYHVTAFNHACPAEGPF